MGENYSLADIAAATGGNDGFGGGSGSWLAMIFLFALIFGFGRGGWGGFGGGSSGGGEPVTESGLCSAMNFNNLQNAVGRLGDTQQAQFTQLTNGICNLGYETLSNFNQVSTQIAQCCCNLERSIDSVNYNSAMNTAAINQNTTAQIQKVLDVLCGNRMADMQNQINGLQLQAALAGVVRYPQGFVYTAGNSPFCCGGYGNGTMI